MKQEIYYTEQLGEQTQLYHKRNIFIKKFYEKCGLETSSRPFCVYKELTTTSKGKRKF